MQKKNKKAFTLAILTLVVILAQGFIKKHEEDKPTNLKILPKDISGDELHHIMRNYTTSLGVRCGFCHVSEQVAGQQRPKYDFASDAKPEKTTARNMMLMTQNINEQFLGKMKDGDRPLELVTCVTCHMGKKTPIVSIDSLVKKN